MPLTFRRLNTALATLDLTWQGEKLAIVYRKGEATPNWLDSFARRTVRQMISVVIQEWDVLGDDGKPVQPVELNEDDPASVAEWNRLAGEWYTLDRTAWEARQKEREEAAEAEKKAQAELSEAHPPKTNPDGSAKGRKVPEKPAYPADDPPPAELTGTPEERRRARERTWELMLGAFPQDFLRYVLNSMVADLTPGK